MSEVPAKSLNGDTLRMLMAAMLSRRDSWTNTTTNLGNASKDARLASTFQRRTMRGREEADSLYETDDIFPLIIDRVPEHATRRWISATGTRGKGKRDDDFGRMLLESLEAIDTQAKCFELMRLDRLYGGAVIVLGADDNQKVSEPLRVDRILKVTHLNVLHRWEINPVDIDQNRLSPTFRQPKFYMTAGAAGLERIHASRVLRLPVHRCASDLSQTALIGWDLPIIERVFDACRQFGTLFDHVEAMFQDLRQGVYKQKGLAETLGADDGTNEVLNRLSTIALARSEFNMIILDEEETYERRSQVPTGLSELMIRSMDRLAAAAEMPLSILFGQAPSGLSTDDESGRRAFYDSIKNKQGRLLRPILNRICEAVIAAKNGPFKGRPPKEWSFEFRPLEEPNEKEDAERRKTETEIDERLITNGIITPAEARTRLTNDPHCVYQLDATLDVATLELDEREDEDPEDDDEEDDDDLREKSGSEKDAAAAAA